MKKITKEEFRQVNLESTAGIRKAKAQNELKLEKAR